MTTVKYFHSGMTGAPVLTGQAGKMIDVLDACLVNGFGSGTADSVVIAGGIATVTRAAGHSFEVDTVALIAGATVSGGSINGEQKVLSITSTTYAFDATGISDQTATGTITHKLAPLGWAKTYSGTNLAAYKPTDVAATGCLLRLDDTGTTPARMVGYLTMSDINTGVGPFPTAAQVSGGAWWPKSSSADATARVWTLIGDSRGFYLYVSANGGNGTGTLCFGDFASRKSPDVYGCVLSGGTSGLSTAAFAAADMAFSSALSTNSWAARGVSGLGSAVAVYRYTASPMNTTGTTYSGAVTTVHMAYPNPADNGLYLVPITIGEVAAAYTYRGDHPGVYYCPQQVGINVFAHREKVTGVTGLAGRTLMALVNAAGPMFVDITGPWAR